ncbi:TIGR03862 family flavoprotein [Parvibaculum sp.]|uniref:TIGR03862 family flavoprotein n=1 Tax=Parvibaculum sp. TaxID=2024848 RepID=UPI0025FB2E8D|nr:TIGR03862 family flavoprotein [Parvibaculum sp.]
MNDTSEKSSPRPRAAILGGGPAGLMAAERLARLADVHVFDSMPSFGRKFLLAGKSGLNITHGEQLEAFLARFGEARTLLEPALRAFPPNAIRDWAEALGIETFEGSSGRIFPVAMKASPLLRAWLARLRESGVSFHARHEWQGWTEDGALRFGTPDGEATFTADVTVLALGGASWPRLGADGSWTPFLSARGVETAPFRPANCGFDIQWSEHLLDRFAGSPLKSISLSFCGRTVKGDFVVTKTGIEGSAVYALSAALRDSLEAGANTVLMLDLAPDRTLSQLASALSAPRGKTSLANHLRKKAGIDGVKAALLREIAGKALLDDPAKLAHAIKNLPLRLDRPRPIAEAISVAGGIALSELDESFMLKKCAGVFAAGEMLDWEAPTGGYLLSACLATGRAAGEGAARWLRRS